MDTLINDMKVERLKTIKQMGVTINHEINNPLAGLLGNVELLLLDGALNEGTRKKLNNIKSLSLRIRDVVKKMAEITEPAMTKYSGNVDMIDIRRSGAAGAYKYINQ